MIINYNPEAGNGICLLTRPSNNTSSEWYRLKYACSDNGMKHYGISVFFSFIEVCSKMDNRTIKVTPCVCSYKLVFTSTLF